jgi:hypothetical protein
MELGLTKHEQKAFQRILKEKQTYSGNIVSQAVALIAAIILLISPLVFIITHFSAIDSTVKTFGPLWGIMAGLGVILVLYYILLKRENRAGMEYNTLRSIVLKVVDKTGITIE